MIAITFKQLQESHGSAAVEIWIKICNIGGFGDVKPGEFASLDFSGCSPDMKKQIAALVAVKGDK